MALPSVSIVLPVRNEERFITRCLDSILTQDYPGDMEILVVDGMSTDRTPEIVKEMFNGSGTSVSPLTSPVSRTFRLLTNEKEKVVFGLNQGIKEAKGDVMVRADGHAVYSENYINECVLALEETKADNVGGVAMPTPENMGTMAKAIALAHLSRFGLGGAKFRVGKGYDGEVETVWPGCFRREVFDKVGLFDERLIRNQDIEMNARIRKAGGRIWLCSRIHSWYFPRATLRGLWQQNYGNGWWVIETLRLGKKCLGLRHLIPLLFVLSILGLLILHFTFYILHFPVSHAPQLLSPSAPLLLLLAELGLYLLLSIVFSFSSAFLAKPDWSIPDRQEGGRLTVLDRLAVLLYLPTVFLTLHLSYGVGSFIRLLQVPFVRRMWKKG